MSIKSIYLLFIMLSKFIADLNCSVYFKAMLTNTTCSSPNLHFQPVKFNRSTVSKYIAKNWRNIAREKVFSSCISQ